MKTLKASALLLALMMTACESGLSPTEPPPPPPECEVGDLRPECAERVAPPNHNRNKGDLDDEE